MNRLRSIVVQAATIVILIALISDLSLLNFAGMPFGRVEPYLFLISVMLLALILVRLNYIQSAGVLLTAVLIIAIGFIPAKPFLTDTSVGSSFVIPIIILALVARFRWVVVLALFSVGCIIWAAISYHWAVSTITSIFNVTITTTGLYLVSLLQNELTQTNKYLVAANVQLQAFSVQAEALATERERTRVARELHDGLGHYLMAIAAQAGAAQVLVERDPERTRATLSKVQALALAALSDVRLSVATLRAAPLDQGTLTEALAALVAEQLDPPASLDIDGTSRPLEPAVERTLYRAVQEGLTNATKHAQATAITIRLTYRPTEVFLFLSDDGQGAADLTGGFGLIGMQERVHLVGGRVSIKTARGVGVQIEIEVPT